MIRLNCDYLEGCHPKILEALAQTNLEQTVGYGLDPYCEQAADMIRESFDCKDAAVHFLTGGTQVNTTLIAAALRPWQGVLCADTGHVNVHETGAIEATGHKVLTVKGKEGRISAPQVSVACALQADDEHTVKPGMVYISLPTELGTMYNISQLKDLYYTCRQLGLYLYIDGARLGYGLASPVCDLQRTDIAKYCDAFTVGGTKGGALFGETLVILNPDLKVDFRYMIKQHGGLLAKGRLLGLQFKTLMEDDLYFALGKKAVDQAMRIRDAFLRRNIPLFVDSPTNQLFPILTDAQQEALEDDFDLSVWERLDEKSAAMRVCTSWATPEESVDAFIRAVEQL